jgi:hypothetical protein
MVKRLVEPVNITRLEKWLNRIVTIAIAVYEIIQQIIKTLVVI